MAHDSIDEWVLELQTLMYANYAAGVSATLESDPTVAFPKTAITVRARIFAPASVLAELAPVLRCEEVAGFGNWVFEEREPRAGFRDYAVTVPSGTLKAAKTYHLTLHPSANADAIAQCTVQIFKKRAVATARRQVRDIILGPSTGTAAPSEQRRR